MDQIIPLITKVHLDFGSTGSLAMCYLQDAVQFRFDWAFSFPLSFKDESYYYFAKYGFSHFLYFHFSLESYSYFYESFLTGKN